ncbi:hypothetical protein MMC16_006826 [Acarospora aff. strigata]|nr:hypothetical protein [Acarospora aff. strigata]
MTAFSTSAQMKYSWPRQEFGEEDEPEEFVVRRVSPRRDHQRSVDKRIYILGMGNIGKLVAHTLSRIPSPPAITLLFHKPSLLSTWEAEGQTIELVTNGISEKGGPFDVELALPERTMSPPSPSLQEATEGVNEGDMIDNLILTVKAPNTVSALSAIKHRLTPRSTIVFLQNGMGIVDEVNTKLFPDSATRPNYILGIITHGVNSTRPFTAEHAGMGTTALGLLSRHPLGQLPSPADKSLGRPPTARYLLRTLTRTPLLAAVGFSQSDLLQLQLEKLAVNAVVNPLSVMLDAKNGDLLSNFALTRVMRLLLAEISLVIRTLPELRDVPNVRLRFAPSRLESIAVSVMTKTSENVSSMLQDVRKGKRTEIDYINGYVVRRGEELGVKCVMNYMLLQLVKGKQQMVDRRNEEDVPIVGEGVVREVGSRA